MIFVLISLEPASVLLILFGSYAVSGIAETWWHAAAAAPSAAGPEAGGRDG